MINIITSRLRVQRERQTVRYNKTQSDNNIFVQRSSSVALYLTPELCYVLKYFLVVKYFLSWALLGADAETQTTTSGRVCPSPGARGRGGNSYKNHREHCRHQQRGGAGQPFFQFLIWKIFLSKIKFLSPGDTGRRRRWETGRWLESSRLKCNLSPQSSRLKRQ